MQKITFGVPTRDADHSEGDGEQDETSAKISLAFLVVKMSRRGALACDKMRDGQPRAVVPHQDFARISIR